MSDVGLQLDDEHCCADEHSECGSSEPEAREDPGIRRESTIGRGNVTIPDIGHCAGSGAPPADGSVKDENEGLRSGVCPACSGRFELHPSGVVSLHDAAAVDDREEWPEPSG